VRTRAIDLPGFMTRRAIAYISTATAENAADPAVGGTPSDRALVACPVLIDTSEWPG
jgi:hypothetical protein